MLRFRQTAVFAITASLVAACGGSSGGGAAAGGTIDPSSQPSEVMESIAIKVGANTGVLKPGDPPAKTNDPADPVINTINQALTISPGGSQSLNLSVESEAPLSSLFAKVVGADSFVEINIANQAKSVAELQTSVDLPANIGSGEFCINFSVANNALLASAPVKVCFVVDTNVLDSLQGEWDGGCDAADDGLNESFLSVWSIEGNVISNSEQRFDGNLDCSGTAAASDVETIEITVLGEATASDGQPATRLSLFNVSEDRSDECLIRVAADSFTIVCGGVDLSQGREFTRPATGFTAQYLSGRAFYLDLFVPGSSEEDSAAQLTFNADGSGSFLFAPSADNSFATNDANPIQWEVTPQGVLSFTEFGDSETYETTVTAVEISPDSAMVESSTVSSDGGTFAANGSFRAADAEVYGFLAGRAFSADIPGSDVERLVFNADGSGTIKFAPNADNSFDSNDVNALHWEASGPDTLQFVEFAGDGYDRNQTNCESNPDISCDLEPYLITFNFSSIGATTASLSYSVSFEGSVVDSGSGSISVE